MIINEYEWFLQKLKENPSDPYAQHMVNVRKPYIRGKRYRGKSTKHLIKANDSNKKDDFDKKECYRTHTDKYYYFYVGHYDKDLYQKQKKNYEFKIRKSKPTGRRWCKLPKEYVKGSPCGNELMLVKKIENYENYYKDRYGEDN
jgi:hypothetical protein